MCAHIAIAFARFFGICEGIFSAHFYAALLVVGQICNNFEKNRAFYDKSMKLGTWLLDNNTKKSRVSATPKMPSNGRHFLFQNDRLLRLIHYNVIFYLQTSCFLQLIFLR